MKLISMSLVLALSFSTAFAEKKSAEEYWNETGISSSFLLKLGLLSKKNCTFNLSNLQGCIAGINSIGARANPPLELVPSSLSKDPTFVGGMPFRIYPDFILVARAKPATESSAMAAWKKENTRREKLKAALTTLLAFKTDADFEKIFMNLLEIA